MLFPYTVKRVRGTLDDYRLAIKGFPSQSMPTYPSDADAIHRGAADLIAVFHRLIHTSQPIPVPAYQEAIQGQAVQVPSDIGIKVLIWNHAVKHDIQRLELGGLRRPVVVPMLQIVDMDIVRPLEMLEEVLSALGLRLVVSAVEFEHVKRKNKGLKRIW